MGTEIEGESKSSVKVFKERFLQHIEEGYSRDDVYKKFQVIKSARSLLQLWFVQILVDPILCRWL